MHRMDSNQSLIGSRRYDRHTGWIQPNVSLALENMAGAQDGFKPISRRLVRIQQPHRSDSNQSLVGFRGYDRCTGRIQTNLSLAPEDMTGTQVRFKPISHWLQRIQQVHRMDSNQSLVGSRGYHRHTGQIQINLLLAPEDTTGTQVRFKPISHWLQRIRQAHWSDSNQSLVGSRGYSSLTGQIQTNLSLAPEDTAASQVRFKPISHWLQRI